MNWVYFLMLVAVAAATKDIESNDISIPPPPVNLDSNLRKALLKALTELENEENEKHDEEGASKTVFFSTTSRNDVDKIVEKASASAVTFYAHDDKTTTPSPTTTSQKPLVVIQKSAGFQHKPLTVDNEEFVASATNSFNEKHTYAKSISLNSVAVNDKSITAGIKSISITPKPEATTPIPTTTTHESEAKVEDVQFFSAPLVAAFTVHQDERGLPKKVEPIYKVAGQRTVSTKVLEEQHDTILRAKQVDELKQQQQQEQLQLQQQQARYRNELALQEKQKALEAEIFNLQQQKKQQENYLLRQQQLLAEQSQRFITEQSRQKQNEQPFVPITNQNQFNRFKTNTLVSFQPSVSITQQDLAAGVLPLNAQILPIRNAIDFLQSPQNFNRDQISNLNNFHAAQQQLQNFNPSIQQQQQVLNNFPSLAPPLQQQPQVPNNFQQFSNNFVQSLPTRQSTRVFRQESNTGNFGFNQFNQNNQFQQQKFNQPQQNRFFRSNQEGFHRFPQQQQHNQQLNNLLYHSGITRNVRQNEDLNIVSKILSYNVGRDNVYTGSRLH